MSSLIHLSSMFLLYGSLFSLMTNKLNEEVLPDSFCPPIRTTLDNSIDPELLVGSWVGYEKIRTTISKKQIGCEFEVKFRVIFQPEGEAYQLELVERSIKDNQHLKCHIAASSDPWKTFKLQYGINLSRYEINGQHLSLQFSGKVDSALISIREVASNIEILRLDRKQLDLKLALKKPYLEDNIISLTRE